ncbi:GpE family phage tail protein [Pseudomonas gingeri]|nr:GpE family phage tail protein [Pseudomonas gingeri]
MAELTRYYHWGPRDAWSLTLAELIEWNKQAIRMTSNQNA